MAGPRITWKTVKGHLRTCILLEDDHWIWMLRKDRGYGRLKIDGVVWQAHRVSYMVHVGPISDGLFALHKPECHRRDCINPDHLYLGTQQDNVDDREEAGLNGKLKLSDQDVATIRQRVAAGDSRADVARDFNIHYGYMSALIRYVNRS